MAETELTNRLRAYATLAPAQVPASVGLYASALPASQAASAAASASIVCSHTRELRGDSLPDYLLPGQDELDVLVANKVANKPAASATDEAPGHTASAPILMPLRPGNSGIEHLALGAAGIPAIKGTP
jgi:hypothetical protein